MYDKVIKFILQYYKAPTRMNKIEKKKTITEYWKKYSATETHMYFWKEFVL